MTDRRPTWLQHGLKALGCLAVAIGVATTAGLAGAAAAAAEGTAVPHAVPGGPGGSTTIPAASFTRGEAETLWNGAAMRFHEKWVEYDLEVRQGGTYDLTVHYAAMGERPVRLSLDGTVLNENALCRVSGSWGNDVPLRDDRTTLKLGPGKHVLRLEAKGLTGHVFDIVIAASDSAGSIPTIQKAKDSLLALVSKFRGQTPKFPTTTTTPPQPQI